MRGSLPALKKSLLFQASFKSSTITAFASSRRGIFIPDTVVVAVYLICLIWTNRCDKKLEPFGREDFCKTCGAFFIVIQPLSITVYKVYQCLCDGNSTSFFEKHTSSVQTFAQVTAALVVNAIEINKKEILEVRLKIFRRSSSCSLLTAVARYTAFKKLGSCLYIGVMWRIVSKTRIVWVRSRQWCAQNIRHKDGRQIVRIRICGRETGLVDLSDQRQWERLISVRLIRKFAQSMRYISGLCRSRKSVINEKKEW